MGAGQLPARLPPRGPDLPDRRPVLSGRALYHELAWAYDALVESTGADTEFVASELERRGVGAGALVVDAGCGTGAHMRGLAARGYRVIGIDSSEELVEEAQRLDPSAELVVADLLEWRPPEPAAAVLCRGVLNDLLDEEERAAALPALAAMLAPRGVLIADVRDWERSAKRYAGRRVVKRRAEGPRGEVALWSATLAERDQRELVVDERLTAAGVEHRHEVRMRPWTRAELEESLRSAGFVDFVFTDPDEAGARDDRMVVVARLSARARV